MTRTFKAIRNADMTGVSGEGHIADGVVFEDGTTVLRWRTKFRSTAVYESFEHMQTIHGHNGATEFRFDPEPRKLEIYEIAQMIDKSLLSIDEARTELGRKPWGFPQTADPLIVNTRAEPQSEAAYGCAEVKDGYNEKADETQGQLDFVEAVMDLLDSIGLGRHRASQ